MRSLTQPLKHNLHHLVRLLHPLSYVPFMDSVFLLGHEARSRLLRTAARAIAGCVYICVWSYIPYPSNCLICAGEWLHEDVSHRLFDMYRGSFCSVESGCVPGFAYKEGMPYIELADSDLMNLTSTQVQKQFYREAGIKKAVFMGCKNGEIELGMSNMSNINVQMIHQLFNEDLIQQYPFPADQSHPLSSTSSLRSPTGSSPEQSSLLLPSSTQPTPTVAMQAYPRQHNIQFPSPAADHDAIMRAMLTVISSSASSSSSPYVYPSPPQQDRPLRSFMPYNQALVPNVEPRSRIGGHKMIKTSFEILRRIKLMKAEARLQESRPPTTNQLYHMISERKRREKLNESFHALRMLLPPGTKKDKASVLISTRDYLKSLKTQVSELENRNRMLELQLLQDDATKETDDSNNETVEVQLVRAPESTSQVQRIALRVTVRVECDMNELLLRVLECLKEMGGVSLVSVNANTFSAQMGLYYARLNLSLQVEACDWDEKSFKEAVTRAIDAVLALPGPETANL